MSACPKCSAPLPQGAMHCPGCGATVAARSTGSNPGMSGPGARAPSGRPGPGSAGAHTDALRPSSVPELDLAPAQPRAPQKPAPARKAELKIELDLGPTTGRDHDAIAERMTGAGRSSVTPARMSAPPGRGSIPSPTSNTYTRPWEEPKSRPSGAGAGARAHADAEAEALEVRVLARYGPPPAKLWEAPIYAWRVLNRQRELRQEMAAVERDAEHADARVEDALVRFAERITELAAKLPGYGRYVERIRSLEQVLRARDTALARETDAHRAEIGKRDQKLVALEKELFATRESEGQVSRQFLEADGTRKRVEERIARLEVEIRSLNDAIEARRKGNG